MNSQMLVNINYYVNISSLYIQLSVVTEPICSKKLIFAFQDFRIRFHNYDEIETLISIN